MEKMFKATTVVISGEVFINYFDQRHDAKAHVGRAFKYGKNVKRVEVCSPIAMLFELVKNEDGTISKFETP